MSVITTNQLYIGKRLPINRQMIPAMMILAGMLFVFLFTPVIKVLPINSEAINRPLNDLLDLALVGIWLVLAFLHWPKAIIQPRWLAVCLWLPPLSYMISIIMYGLTHFSIDVKQLYIFMFSLRPLALTGIVVLICRWGKFSPNLLNRILQIVVWLVALNTIYVSVLALLQIRQITAAQQFIYTFYKYELANPEIVYEAVTRYGRASSIFHWPNSLGVFLVVNLFLMMNYLGNSIKRIWLVIPIAIGVLGVILSGSRTGFLILSMGLAIMIFYRRQFLLLFLLGIGGLLFGLIIGFVEAQTEQSSRLYELIYWLTGAGPMPLTFRLRIENWVEAIVYYINQPTVLTGITIIGERAGNLLFDSFDNEYLVYFVWNGLIGLLCFLLFQFGLALYAFRLVLQSRRIKALSVLAMFLFTVALTMPLIAMSQEVWNQQRLLHLVFICLGLVVYNKNMANTKYPQVSMEATDKV